MALQLMKDQNIEASFKLLEKCLDWSRPGEYGDYPVLRSLTYNHIGCCYRRLDQLDEALENFSHALKAVALVDKPETLGITHVNMCAVLS